MATDLSQRLGYWTYLGRSASRPTLLSRGARSLTESDQRRALMLPQELLQMPADRLILLRAGMAPVLGRKIVYWREKAFSRRVVAPPAVLPHPGALSSASPASPRPILSAARARPLPAPETDMADLTLDLTQTLAAGGVEPLPRSGASEAEVEAWVERYIDAAMRTPTEPRHGR